MRHVHPQHQEQVQRMVHFITVALIFLSISWACLTIGVFTADPRSIIGLIFLCLGLISLCIFIVFLVRYAMISRRIQGQR